ncbi:MAG: PQQ-dependent sugar dehydrogenase [Ferruginibacter sp.]
MNHRALLIAFIFSTYLCSCNFGASSNNDSLATDSVTIASGGIMFNQNCGGCHNFRQDAIGPQLGGITDAVSTEWIVAFVKNPTKIIESGDTRALALSKKYKVAMPAFAHLKDDEINNIIAFLHTQKPGNKQQAKETDSAISNPIPEPIALSGLNVGLELITQVPASSIDNQVPLARITKLDFEPHSGERFIVDLRGKLYKLQNNKPLVYMDLPALKPNFIHEPRVATGFGSFAFHPDFAKNGLLYTSHSEKPGSGKADFGYADSIKVTLQWVITEWKTNDPQAATFSGTSRELFRVNMVTGMHGVQEIAFNPLSKPGRKDYGLLYICIGDGASVEEGYPFLAHTTDKVWGSILRIDPAGSNSSNGHYGIPADNPFVISQHNKMLGEIYAYGFRNPHRISWTRSGKMLAANIGQGNIEAIDLVLPGHDYGWPIREGNFMLNPYGDLNKAYPLPANDSSYKITYPVAAYDHDEGVAICGGFEYWGASIPQLNGKYLFGDIASGRLFYINVADIQPGKQAHVMEWKISVNGKPHTLKELCKNERADLHFGKDAKGELYILTKTDGKVYKLVNATIASANAHK